MFVFIVAKLSANICKRFLMGRYIQIKILKIKLLAKIKIVAKKFLLYCDMLSEYNIPYSLIFLIFHKYLSLGVC